MEKHYIKADSNNLPKVDAYMVAHYFATNPDFCSAEFRNVKSVKASRQSYGDDAIGYVQLRREAGMCTLKCKICPEHKIRKQPYNATMVIDEGNDKILSVQCHDCPASQGGCKHSVAFLMWSHRRSEEPSKTSTECYWKKSTLAKIGSSLKYVPIKEMLKKENLLKNPQGEAVLLDFIEEGKRRKLENCQILKHHSDYEAGLNMLSMHYLNTIYNEIEDCDQFLKKVSHIFTTENLNKVEAETRDQHQNAAWHELRYARITASKAYDVTRCKTPDGSLTALIMGAKIPDTEAMKRGRKLENSVRMSVEKKLGSIRKCGLLISEQYPMLAGSPDGILNDKEIIEIKCPMSDRNFKNYINNGAVTPKFETQVQLQLHLANMKKGYFCVADSNFEVNSEVTIIPVHYNEILVNRIICETVSFWKNNIYPILFKNSQN